MLAAATRATRRLQRSDGAPMLRRMRPAPSSLQLALALATLGALTLLAPACGDDESGGSKSAPTLESAYCAPLAELVCGRAVACGCGAAFPAGLDEASCIEAYTARCTEAYAPIAQAIEAGDAKLHAERAAECIQLLVSSTTGCEAPRASVVFGTCPAWYASEVEIGEACEFPICADGRGSCVDGVCVDRPGEGASCEGYECEPGLVCSGEMCTRPGLLGASCAGDEACDPPLRCLGGSCAELGGQSASCESTSTCAQGLECGPSSTCDQPTTSPCTDSSQCGNLALCAVPRACGAPGGAGSPCSQDAQCLPGHGCALDSSTCVLRPGSGEPCADGIHCGPGLACTDAGGSCAPAPEQGEPCAFGEFGPFVCAEGLGCIADAFVCGALPVEGEPCTVDSRCASGFGCAFGPEGSFCIVPKTAGGSCENDATCAADHHCGEGGVCTSDVATGEPCQYGNECREGDTCTADEGGSLRCLPLPRAGEPCLFDCAEGLACVGDPSAASCVPEVCGAL